ncbi:hypothetical protein ACOME3_005790 [Neoechinorhynchus agilis]
MTRESDPYSGGGGSISPNMDYNRNNAKMARLEGGRCRRIEREDRPITLPEANDRLQMLIFKLAEREQENIERDIVGVSKVIMATAAANKQRMIEYIFLCITSVPHKIPVYTALCGLLNNRSPEFGERLCELLGEELSSLFEAADELKYEHFRFMFRFTCDLVNASVVSYQSILSFMRSTLDSCGASQKGDKVHLNVNRRTDFLVYCILSSIPWCGRLCYKRAPNDLKHIVTICTAYVKSNRPRNYCAFLQVWNYADPHVQEEYLDCILAQIENLEIDEYSELVICRTYDLFIDALVDAPSHNVPNVTFSPFKENGTYPLPKVIFRLFDYTDVPDEFNLPGNHSIERFLIEEQIANIVYAYSKERIDCVKSLLDLKIQGNVPIDYMIIEVIYGLMLNLPRSWNIQLFYSVLLLEFCRLAPNRFPEIMAQTTELMFDRMPSMKTICRERIIDWFAYNLSNFQIRWSWDYWTNIFTVVPNTTMDANLDESEVVDEMGMTNFNSRMINYVPDKKNHYAKVQFMIGVMDRLVRLSFHTNVEHVTPPQYHCIIPRSGHYFYKYDKAFRDPLLPTEQDELVNDPLLLAISVQLRVAISERLPSDDIQEILQSYTRIAIKQPDDGKYSIATRRMDVLMTVLMWVGSKTISHAYSLIHRYRTLIKMFMIDEECEMACIRAIYDVCRESRLTLILFTDKLLHCELIGVSSVCRFIFTLDPAELENKHIWELLHNAMEFQRRQINKLKNALTINDDGESAQLTKRIDFADRQFKDALYAVFDRLINAISQAHEREQRIEVEDDDFNNFRAQLLLEQMHAIFANNHRYIREMIGPLKKLVFTSDIDFMVIDLFNQYCALYNDGDVVVHKGKQEDHDIEMA